MPKVSITAQETPPCGRCGESLLLQTQAMDEVLSLCRICDAHDPSAAAVIAWFDAGNGLLNPPVPAVTQQGADLLTQWMQVQMARRGWDLVENPEPPATFRR